MTEIINKCTLMKEKTSYHQVRRAQAKIAAYLHFGDHDLSCFLGREAFSIMANRLASHYFHRSANLALWQHIEELYTVELIMAPILQRLPMSCKFDWHAGHIMSWLRTNIRGNINRNHFGLREIPREFAPDLLAQNLETLGIHDNDMVEVLQDLHRRHACGTTLQHRLAHQIFDPILLCDARQGYELRFGNQFIRLEREPFPGSVDLRVNQADVLNFRISVCEHRGGRHLEILIAPELLSNFRHKIQQILSLHAPPQYKLQQIEVAIRNLVELTRPARSAGDQVKDQKKWLTDKLRPLSSTAPDAKAVANRLLTQWLSRVDNKLHLKKPTFFLDPKIIDEKTFITFFSPYREMAYENRSPKGYDIAGF